MGRHSKTGKWLLHWNLMDSRRNFIGKVATGLAGTLAARPASLLGANDRIRVGIIGAGDRGSELANHIRASQSAEIAGFADIYRVRLDRATSTTPGATPHADYRALLDDRSIDAVFIATPQHLHAQQFIAALEAGKHIYLEKTAALSLAEAKQMRVAVQKDNGRHTIQIGHQSCSTGHLTDVRQFLCDPQRMGKVTTVSMQMHRATPMGKAQWARPALFTSDLTKENVRWQDFLGNTPQHDFDRERLIHWRYFWDYSGGGVFENMSQQLAFWYKALNLQIPATASMAGGVYIWKDAREVPDTMSVTLEQPEEILINWVSGFSNNQLGVSEDVLGTHGSISRASQVRYIPQKLNHPTGTEMTGRSVQPPHAHVENFLASIRGNEEPNCPFELGYRVSVACRMAVESYHHGRTVRWDPAKQEIF
jgi:predicted dehydrogenase